MSERLKRFFPALIFVVFCAVILGAVLVLQPGWGFMDDYGVRTLAVSFWENPGKLDAYMAILKNDAVSGRFRPVYFLWSMVSYGLFQSHPLALNFFLTLLGLLCLPLWGKIMQIAYSDDDSRLLWLYGLSFFIFTPFANIFMYISLQERFYLVWGGLAFLFYLLAKKRDSVPGVILSLCFLILLVLSKETGLSILASFCVYSLVDVIFLTKEKKANGIFLIGSILFVVPYLLFLKKYVLGGGYSRDYSVGNSLALIGEIPLICKGMLAIAVLALGYFIYERFFLKRSPRNNYLWVLFPLCLMSYIGLLIPWGYPSYMLAPVAVFIFATLYLPLRSFNPLLKNFVYAGCVSLSLLVVVFSVVPAIGVMADKGKVTEFVHDQLKGEDVMVYFPPPFTESAESLGGFSGANVVYVKGVLEEPQLNAAKKNYLIMHLDCKPVHLRNHHAADEIYRNNTWSIQKITASPGAMTVVEPQFEVNHLTKLKKKIKDL